MQIRSFLLALFLVVSSVCCRGQDTALLGMLDDSSAAPARVVTGTFKATQLINTPTIEAPAKSDLQFMIMHRFGRINEGAYALFGLDNAGIRFAFDYGLSDRITLGVGRSSFDKVYDASLKWKLLQQRESGLPLSLSAFGTVAHTTQRFPDKPFLNAKLRTMYAAQLLLARKFSSRLSLQVAPAWVHFNLVQGAEDRNDVFALGTGGRYKISRRVSITGEYNYLPSAQVVSVPVYHSVSAGVDIETGGHVFQLVFSNSQGMILPYFLARTSGSWSRGDVYFGFNVTRNFSTGKRRRSSEAESRSRETL